MKRAVTTRRNNYRRTAIKRRQICDEARDRGEPIRNPRVYNREAMIELLLDGLSIKEVAKMVGCSIGPVKLAKQEMVRKGRKKKERVVEDETPWMTWINKHIGETEIPGIASNPFIVECFDHTTLAGTPLALLDETAWCAALACAALEKTGFESPHSAAAAEFDNYGIECQLKYGAIMTFKREGGSGRHVTFFSGEEDDRLLRGTGGNQGNSLKPSLFSRAQLVSVRWPIKRESRQS